MSELRIVTPEECPVSDEAKRALVDDVNKTLRSGQRAYTVPEAHLDLLKELAGTSGWHVAARHYNGDVVDVVFSVAKNIVAKKTPPEIWRHNGA